MTNRVVTRIPAKGQAWLGDWRARLLARLVARGYRSVSAFAYATSHASLLALAQELSTNHEEGIDHADVAADQVARLWREEAQRNGPREVERMARRILVGELRSELPEGWQAKWDYTDDINSPASRFLSAATSWIGNVGKENEAASERILAEMIAEGKAGKIPAGWVPEDAEDPILVDIFSHYWKGSHEP